MKKVKTMLVFIAILAFVGGVFAFKAKTAFIASIYYTTYTTSYRTGCNLPALSVTTTTRALFITSYYYTVTNFAAPICNNPKTYITSVDGI
jgi:hypothetical protein